MSDKPFSRIAILGIGLIGGSIASAVRKHLSECKVTGYDPVPEHLEYAMSSGMIDEAASLPEAAVKNAELVIIASPPRTFSELAERMASSLADGAIIMDVGSVKQRVMEDIAPRLPKHAAYVPAHPIAGSAECGPQAADSDLFERRRVILTPSSAQETEPVVDVIRFWKTLGADVEMMPAPTHDLVYAYVSHLPQLLAFTLPAVLGEHPGGDETFRRFIRLCGSSTGLWSDILTANRDAVGDALSMFVTLLGHMKQELSEGPKQETKVDPERVATVLFPRIVASCLVATVHLAERNNSVSFARYAGTGFADFTAPAESAPEAALKEISDGYAQLLPMIDAYLERLKPLAELIRENKPDILRENLTRTIQ